MDPTAMAAAVGIIVLGEFVVGHWLLFPLFYFAAGLPPRLAIRLAHVCGFGLGYAFAACGLGLTSGVLVWWGGASLVPGLPLLLVGLLVLALVVFSPPGPLGAGS